MDYRNPNTTLYLLQEIDKKYAKKEAVEKLSGEVDALEKKVDDFQPETVGFTTDETLSFTDGVLKVNTAKEIEADNTLPITSAAVYAVVGNISALLDTI